MQPQLHLGLIGFDVENEAMIRRWLADHTAQTKGAFGQQQPVWRVVDFLEADALLIRGAGVAQGVGTQLQLLPALHAAQHGTPLGVDLADLKMPFALSDIEHLQALGIDILDSPVFYASQAESLLKTMQFFEKILRLLCSLFALAAELTERKRELDMNHTYHLERNVKLYAVIDVPKRRVLLHPDTQPEHIAECVWHSLPKSADFAPAKFLVCRLDELGWVYAMHCQGFDLPKRYLSKPIHILHNPRVRASMLYPRHAVLINQLWHSPLSLEQLQNERPELGAWLQRDLYALYITHCISTQKPDTEGADSSSLANESDDSSPVILRRLGKHMNTMAGNLPSLY